MNTKIGAKMFFFDENALICVKCLYIAEMMKYVTKFRGSRNEKNKSKFNSVTSWNTKLDSA